MCLLKLFALRNFLFVLSTVKSKPDSGPPDRQRITIIKIPSKVKVLPTNVTAEIPS